MANCSSLGALAEPEICPKVLEPNVTDGKPKMFVFVTLNASTRSVKY